MAPAAVRHFPAQDSDGDTGLKAITSITLKTTAAGQVDLKRTDTSGTVIIPIAFAAAGQIHLSFASPLVCSDGTWFWEYTSGTWTGAVSGY